VTIYTRSCCQTAYILYLDVTPSLSPALARTWSDLPPLLTFRKRSYLFRHSYPGLL